MPCAEGGEGSAPSSEAIRAPARRGGRGLSRWMYYLSSIPTILLGMKSRWAVLRLFLGLPVKRPLVVRLPSGARFLVWTRMDVWIVKESCLDRDYESGAPPIPDGSTVLDIGAGFGDFAVRVARDCPRATVYAFEPLPESFERLQQNIRLNGVENVRAFPEAISGSDAPMPLYTVTGLSGQHRTAGHAPTSAAGSIDVPAITLARAFERHGIATCDFLKIDCEGAEFEILLRCDPATLARVRRIALEYHDAVTDHRHDELVRLLEGCGFRVTTKPSPAYHELGFLYAQRPL
jgi:FkbM family methyltransferase